MELVTLHHLPCGLVILIHFLCALRDLEAPQSRLFGLLIPEGHTRVQWVVNFQVVKLPLQHLDGAQIAVLRLKLHVGEGVKEVVRAAVGVRVYAFHCS